MPEVSVVVPAYKVEPYLRQCVDSVLAQTFTDYELILVDDGSPDACGEICDEYAAQDGRIRVIHQENGGLGKARNTGMDQAVGKYLIFLDSDDYWLPDTLEILHAEAERNQTQVLAFGSKRFWDGVEKPEQAAVYWRMQKTQIGIVKTGPESLKVALDTYEFSTEVWDKFYLRDYLLSTGLRFDEGTIHSDIRVVFLSYLFAERVECIGACLHRYRVRPDSIMNSRSFQGSAHGHAVFLRGLMEVWLSHSRPAQEELLIERRCGWAIAMIRDCYARARMHKDWKAAKCIQEDALPALRQARALPGLSLPNRLAAYNLFLSWLASRAKYKLKWLGDVAGKACTRDLSRRG